MNTFDPKTNTYNHRAKGNKKQDKICARMFEILKMLNKRNFCQQKIIKI